MSDGKPAPRRLAPLLAGTSAGSLGPADLEAIGISIVAVDVLELYLAVGLDRLVEAGGLGAFIGWPGPIVAVARYSDEAPEASGWRARGLPHLLGADGDTLRLRSPIDGAIVSIALDQLRTDTVALGANTVDAGGDLAVKMWADADTDPPTTGIVVTDLAQAQAAAGRFRAGRAWRHVAGAPDRSLAAGCECRSCRIATGPYLAHLWAMREITAEHLLAWHNLHQLRAVVEDPA